MDFRVLFVMAVGLSVSVQADVPCEAEPLLTCLYAPETLTGEYFCQNQASKVLFDRECLETIGWQRIEDDARSLTTHSVAEFTLPDDTSAYEAIHSVKKLQHHHSSPDLRTLQLLRSSAAAEAVKDEWTDLSRETCSLLQKVRQFSHSPRLKACASREDASVGTQYQIENKWQMRRLLYEVYTTERSAFHGQRQISRIVAKPLRLIAELSTKLAASSDPVAAERQMIIDAFKDVFDHLRENNVPDKYIAAIARILENRHFPFLYPKQLIRYVSNNERIAELQSAFLLDLDRAVQMFGDRLTWQEFGQNPRLKLDFKIPTLWDVWETHMPHLCFSFLPATYAYDEAMAAFGRSADTLEGHFDRPFIDYMKLVNGQVDENFVKQHDKMKSPVFPSGTYALKSKSNDYDIKEFVSFLQSKPFFDQPASPKGLADILIYPVQRGPRYKLLLAEVVKAGTKLTGLGFFDEGSRLKIESLLQKVETINVMNNQYTVQKQIETGLNSFPVFFRRKPDKLDSPSSSAVESSPKGVEWLSFASSTRCFVRYFKDLKVKLAADKHYVRCNAIAFNDLIVFVKYDKDVHRLPYKLVHAVLLPSETFVHVSQAVAATAKKERSIRETNIFIWAQDAITKQRIDFNVLLDAPRDQLHKQELDEFLKYLDQVALILYNKKYDVSVIEKFFDPLNALRRRVELCTTNKLATSQMILDTPSFSPLIAYPWTNRPEVAVNRGCILCQLAVQNMRTGLGVEAGLSFSSCEMYADYKQEEEYSACKAVRCLAQEGETKRFLKRIYSFRQKVPGTVTLEHQICRTVPGLSDFCVGAKEFERPQKCWACIYSFHALRKRLIEKFDKPTVTSFQFANYICKRLGLPVASSQFKSCLTFFGVKVIFENSSRRDVDAKAVDWDSRTFWSILGEFMLTKKHVIEDVLRGSDNPFTVCRNAGFCSCGDPEDQSDFETLMLPANPLPVLPSLLPSGDPKPLADLPSEVLPSRVSSETVSVPSSTSTESESVSKVKVADALDSPTHAE